MIGITSYGCYVPRRRLNRMAIMQSMGWFAPGLMMAASGERSMCNWDEDSMTMAVAAARDCLAGADRAAVDACYLASTTPPFCDRQNSGILAAAANLREDGLVTADFSASTKSGTTAVLAAIDAIKGGEKRSALVTASDARAVKSAWFYEMWYGDGAASLLLGTEGVIAEFKAAHTVSCDFVPSYRGANAKFDYGWEERWIRDEGYSKIIPAAIAGLLAKCGLSIDAISKIAYPCYLSPRVHLSIAQAAGASPDKVVSNMHDVLGDTGAAHPLMMFVSALEQASPGDKIVMAGFGQGCDALLFEVTDAVKQPRAGQSFSATMAKRKEENNYAKFQKFRETVNVEMGIRAEAKKQTALSALWRKRKMVLGLVGGRCTECGTPQFPPARMCVAPGCNSVGSQEDYEFADRNAVVKSYTGDMLAVSVDPPAIYGLVQFDGGGRMLADFTDCELGEVKVGLPARMSFRVKYYDAERDFHGYFWKAVPQL